MDTVSTISSILGTLTAIIIGGAVLAGIPAIFYSLRGKPMTKAQTWCVFAVGCALVVLGLIISRSAKH